MAEKYLLIEVYGNQVVCNCPYLKLREAKMSLKQSFEFHSRCLMLGRDCQIDTDGMSAWALINGIDRVWTIVKVPK